jgi:RNA polymerase sigma-70 factor (ECF subfamily)
MSGPEEIVGAHNSRLIAIVQRNLPTRLRNRLDPEDVVQSVFRSYFRRQDEGRLDDSSVDDLGRFLVTMALNKVRNAIQFHQRQRRDVRKELVPEHADAFVESRDLTLGQAEDSALAELLNRLLEGLPEVHREIVMLRMSGTSIADIALDVSRSQRTVIRVLKGLEDLARKEVS